MTEERHGKLEESEYDKDNRNRTILATAILVGAVLIVCLSIAGFFINKSRAENTAKEIRYSQYISCVNATNDIIRQVRDEFKTVKRETLIPVFSHVAKTIPEGSAARNILERSVQNMKFSVDSIEDRIPTFSCRKLYPPLEGQTYLKVD